MLFYMCNCANIRMKTEDRTGVRWGVPLFKMCHYNGLCTSLLDVKGVDAKFESRGYVRCIVRL